jgi:hypothetical protein
MSSFYTVQDEIRELTRGPVPIISFPTNTGPIVPPLTNAQPIPKIIKIVGWQYPSPRDPFSLSYEEYTRLTYEEALELQKEVQRISSSLIEDAWKRGKRQIVICDGKVVYQTANLADIPNEKIDELAKKCGKACYVFSAPDIIEESAWILVDAEDYYPTISIFLGEENSDESRIMQTCQEIAADFDTGNPIYKVFDANQLAAPLSSFTPPLRTGIHLGRNYTYFQKRAKICVEDTSGKVHSTVQDVRLVEDWKGSALLQCSPNRKGYLGRDILRDLGIKIELNPLAKITRIHGISS